MDEHAPTPIRLATPAPTPAVALLDPPAVVEAHEIEIRACRPSEVMPLREHFPSLPAEPAGTTLVAWFRGAAVGHIQIRWAGSVHSHIRARMTRVPEIRRLRVIPGLQGNGIAKALLSTAERCVVSAGYRSVGLAVGVNNVAAKTLYERCGYHSAGFATFCSPWGRDELGRPFNHEVVYLAKKVYP